MKRALAAALALLLLPANAWGHLMPAQQGTLNVVGNAVFAAIALPLSAFTAGGTAGGTAGDDNGNTTGDDNGDGRLSQVELTKHAAAIQAQVAQHIHILDGEKTGSLDLVMPMVEPDERSEMSTAGATHILVLMKVTFAAPPEALRFDTDLWGKLPAQRQLTIKATRGKESEAAVLSPQRSHHQFFRSQWAVLRDYMAVGVEHILFGADHLLFLLTIIVAAAGWRYWLGVLTSFTVAHSITVTLALYGVVRAPASLVEPLIAASIVLVAVLNLRQSERKVAQRIAIVFACGLLHGLGFASAIADMGLSSAYRVASVLGFNAGIEAGQALCVVAVLALLSAMRATARILMRNEGMARVGDRLSLAQAASLVAAVVGAFWFVQRAGAVSVLLAQAIGVQAGA